MSQLGMGVMINMLGGNRETVETLQGAVGKVIREAKIESDELRISFTDGTGIAMWDSGQSCCESRYMRTDDDLAKVSGASFRGAELRDAAETPADEYGDCHEIQFLVVKTSDGEFTCSNHNEHNGYYGGFSISAKPWTQN